MERHAQAVARELSMCHSRNSTSIERRAVYCLGARQQLLDIAPQFTHLASTSISAKPQSQLHAKNGS